MSWKLDEKFRIPGNEAIVRFIDREHPSAHDDIATVLINSAKGLTDVQWHCPEANTYACVVLHTLKNRIFGIAFSMSGLAFRLAPQLIHKALQDGGRVINEIGEEWVMFESSADVARWCKIAHDVAVASYLSKEN